MSNKTKKQANPRILRRLLKDLFRGAPILLPLVFISTILSSVITALPAIFQQKILAVLTDFLATGNRSWPQAKEAIFPLLAVLVALYLLSVILITFQTQAMNLVTQHFLHSLRQRMFNHMQDLPLSFFDQNKHGDIMSYYTNDVQTLRMLVSGGLPSMVRAGAIVLTLFAIMIYYSLPMTLLVSIGVGVMFLVTRKVAGGSARFFREKQKKLGDIEGFLQEYMTGQKVVKVFNHEDQAIQKMEEKNQALFEVSSKANGYANALGPIIMNIGNVMYVLAAMVGGVYLLSGLPNISISGMAFSLSILIPFLNMTKQFTGNINQFSQQINSVVMAMAGADRIYRFLDQEEEIDEGRIRLVHCREDAQGRLEESPNRDLAWYWKIPQADGSFSYKPMRGDMRMEGVDFSYVPGEPVLHDITVYAEPGQQVAFVGQTGAGKTTITNLMNRFYEIEGGKILYDGIDIREIRKEDLRRSLGLVLQSTNLFTGTVMENIRYGRLDATDEDCIESAKITGAHSFIARLPEGYQTRLTANGANLSQGQRQLLSISRAAVAGAPALVLDEATSSIDTHTEQMVLEGMARLMEGRTVFVIAHRLSTIENSDVIMVMDQGRIIERGSHDDLLKEKGVYYQLYTGAFEME